VSGVRRATGKPRLLWRGLRLQPAPANPAGAVATCHRAGVPARDRPDRPDRSQQPGRRSHPARTTHPHGRMGRITAHRSQLPGHARPASRPRPPVGAGADREPVTDRVRHRPGRHCHHLRPARQQAPAQSGSPPEPSPPSGKQTASWASPCSAPSSPAFTPPLGWKSRSRSAPSSLPSSPGSATPPPNHPARPSSHFFPT
jgi:hypothetical protein